jgi:hypothetical protein
MLLPDDDELYEVDQTYLGPPGRYIGTFRFKAIAAWLALGPLTFVLMRKLGVPMTLLTVGLAILIVSALAGAIADVATTERPLTSVIRSFVNDLRATRPTSAVSRARVSRYRRRFRPRGPLGKWIERNATTD